MVNIESYMDDINFKNTKEVVALMRATVPKEDFDKAYELCGDKFGAMYDEWLANYGQILAVEWVDTNGGFLIGYDDITQLTRSLLRSFMEHFQA